MINAVVALHALLLANIFSNKAKFCGNRSYSRRYKNLLCERFLEIKLLTNATAHVKFREGNKTVAVLPPVAPCRRGK